MTRVYLFPGQGAQRAGMGLALFKRFPHEVAAADELLGYSLEQLCAEDGDSRLHSTEYTQPALYAVNALHYLELAEREQPPDYLAGHSLGEYNALFAAGAFDFLTGLRMVQRRGQLMARATGGAMAAVVGLSEPSLRDELAAAGFDAIDVANLNSPIQTVISGQRDDIAAAAKHLGQVTEAEVVMLRVSGAFHSRYMTPLRAELASFLDGIQFGPLRIPVLSNVHAQPYDQGAIAATLAQQLTSPVRWNAIVCRLLSEPEVEFKEVGPGKTLMALLRQIKARGTFPDAVKSEEGLFA
jgi:malonyl CoA-acyl carrier protein transacylase